jgi:hypothetical protein
MAQALHKKLLEFHNSKKNSNSNISMLDIGGWFAPCKQATHMVDIMPFETLNVAGAYGNGELLIRPENYTQLDLGGIDRLPFADKQFDFVVCRHTLEDIKDPILISKEMMRVAKAGYIETPHRIYESTKGVERHWWCGHYHHRWLVEVEGNKISFQFKPHNLHSNPSFYWRRYPWQRVREEYKNTSLLWENSFKTEEKIIIDYRDLKTDLTEFKKIRGSQRIMRSKWRND